MKKPDFLAILNALAARKVEFLVVGGVAAALQGAPITTFDIDIVHRREPGNIERLVEALRELEAYFREKPEPRIAPTASLLVSSGHHLLLTRHGPLDILGTIGADRDYDDLVGESEEVTVGPISLRVLSLSALIATKEELMRDKDRAVLAILRSTLRERLQG